MILLKAFSKLINAKLKDVLTFILFVFQYFVCGIPNLRMLATRTVIFKPGGRDNAIFTLTLVLWYL